MRFTMMALVFIAVSFQPREADATIRIGLAIPLSGPFAEFGKQQQIAADAAVETINDTGGILGRLVEVILVDDQCLPHAAARAARTLVYQDRVDAVVGHVCDRAAAAAAPVYARDRVPFFTLSDLPLLTDPENVAPSSNIFRLCGRFDRQAADAATYLAGRFGSENFAGVFSNNDYGNVSRAAVDHLGIRSVFQHPLTLEGVPSLLTELQQRKVQAAMVFGAPPVVALRLIRKADLLGLQLAFFFDNTAIFPQFREGFGSWSDGTMFSLSCYVPVFERALEDALDATLLRSLRDSIKNEVIRDVGFAPHTFAAFELVRDAAASAGSVDRDALIAALRSSPFYTVVGRLMFDDKGDIVASMSDAGYIQQYINQRFMVMAGEVVHWIEDAPCNGG